MRWYNDILKEYYIHGFLIREQCSTDAKIQCEKYFNRTMGYLLKYAKTAGSISGGHLKIRIFGTWTILGVLYQLILCGYRSALRANHC
jgi:hypothetical protein